LLYGSGSTALDVETKRNSIGFELDKSYYETSQNRISLCAVGFFLILVSTETSIERIISNHITL
jgi:DNA modification methylase